MQFSVCPHGKYMIGHGLHSQQTIVKRNDGTFEEQARYSTLAERVCTAGKGETQLDAD